MISSLLDVEKMAFPKKQLPVLGWRKGSAPDAGVPETAIEGHDPKSVVLTDVKIAS
jgi:hypothetical protein